MAIDLYLVRHGQTYFNLLNRFQGHADAPLTAAGIEHGHAAGQRLKHVPFVAAYSSDLTRAIHTATYALSENEAGAPERPALLPDFREENFGSFEGRDTQVAMTELNAYLPGPYASYSALVQDKGMPFVFDLFAKADPYKLAENYQDFRMRIERGFQTLLDRHDQADQAVPVLLVAHGTAIRAIADYFGRADLANESIHNGAVMHLQLTAANPKGASIQHFNDITTVF
ncbi:histidine phosphatase family protein [Leuconostocaceae bacterium ESL0958]|nr:histidine phosphatase family protein [Leuconostocaceae bacterium ESL0958]